MDLHMKPLLYKNKLSKYMDLWFMENQYNYAQPKVRDWIKPVFLKPLNS